MDNLRCYFELSTFFGERERKEMDLLKVDLENCYGIGKLKKEFDFKGSKGCVIYSQNGTGPMSI